MATKSKKTTKKPKRKYTKTKQKSKPKKTKAKSKPKTKVVYRTKYVKSSPTDDIGDMTKTVGKLAVTGAGTMMILGVGKGMADAFKGMGS